MAKCRSDHGWCDDHGVTLAGAMCVVCDARHTVIGAAMYNHRSAACQTQIRVQLCADCAAACADFLICPACAGAAPHGECAVRPVMHGDVAGRVVSANLAATFRRQAWNLGRPRLVAFVGRRGSGKDTAARCFTRCGFHPLAFADPLKTAVMALFQLTEEDMQPGRKELPGPLGVSYRRGMQVLGTDLIRQRLPALLPEAPPRLFVANMRARLDELLARGGRAVITDVRFSDEARMLRELGAVVIGLVRAPGHAEEAADRHASEASVDEVLRDPALTSETIENDGCVGELWHRCSAACARS